MIEDPKNGEPVTSCMDGYKVKIQSDGSLDKLKLRIVVRGELKNKEMVGYTWSPKASMSTLKYFLADATKHKARFHQLDFIRAFLQAKVKNTCNSMHGCVQGENSFHTWISTISRIFQSIVSILENNLHTLCLK